MPQGRGVCAHSAGQWGESAAGRGVCVCARRGVEDRTQESAYLKASEMLPQARLSHHFPQDPETGIVPVLLTCAVPVTRTRFWLPRKVRLLFCHCKV